MNYETALNFIKATQSLGIMPGLSRIKNAMHHHGNPQNKLRVIHVAGTNGKGTICNSLALTLHSQGYKVGLFTSPWVVDFREQIQIDGNFIPKDKLAEYVDLFSEYQLTEFELMTAIMYKYFYDEKVDFAVVECGLGGENDATNILDNTEIAVISSISLDHTNIIGNSISDIATEKSGIIKHGAKTVLYPDINGKEIFIQKCNICNADYTEADNAGSYLENDYNVVKCVLKSLNINCEIVKPKLPARTEWINSSVLIDGAHNPDGAKALISALPTDKKTIAIIAMMRDKDVSTYLSIVAPHFSKIIATSVPNNSRAMSAKELQNECLQYCSDVISVENPHDALSLALEENSTLIVCGSFYLAREIRKDF